MRFFVLPAFFVATIAIAAIAPVAATTLTLPSAAPSSVPLTACSTQNPAFVTDDLSGMVSPCAADPGSWFIETLYYQNASRYGGTALAAYPLFRVRTGVVRNVEVILDMPSQVAESGLAGAGLYPTTHLGLGLKYTFLANARAAAAFGVELLPPSSRFAVEQFQSQPRYLLALSVGYHLTRQTTLTGFATGTSSSSVGFERVTPGLAVRFAYDAGDRTQISTDLGTRVYPRRSVAQSYGDVAVNQRLRKNLTFDIGLGTMFNPLSDAKAHYLASGFNFHLK